MINQEIDNIVVEQDKITLEKKKSELTYNYVKILKSDVIAETDKSILIKPVKAAFAMWLTKSYILTSNYSNIMSLTVANEYVYDVLLDSGSKEKINGTYLLNTLKKVYKDINFESKK